MNDCTKWATEKFPDQNVSSQLKHLEKELEELKESPNDPSEIPDMAILLIGLAHLQGYNLFRLMADKFYDDLIHREWKMDEDGVYIHK